MTQTKLPGIGVLAIQGNYASHAQALTEAGATPVEVRKPEQLAGLNGLVLPGGESTTMLKFLKLRFFEVLQEFCRSKPVFGTCAGVILLAREVLNPPQRSLGLLDVTIERNAYGRQIDSVIVTAETELAGGPLEMVFIRSPRITQTGPGVEVLATREGFPVLIRQGRIRQAKKISLKMYNDGLDMLADEDVVVPKARPTAFLADISREPIRWRATLYAGFPAFASPVTSKPLASTFRCCS